MNAGLVEYVERTVRSERSKAPDRPVYLVGESVGACIALAVAARNRDIDLVLILVNPGPASIVHVSCIALFFSENHIALFFPRTECLTDQSAFILAFTGTSFHKSQLQSLSAFLDLVPDPFHLSTPQFLNFLTGLEPSR
jgi:pimeloyl-ACP methyl ester carboxylesterase